MHSLLFHRIVGSFKAIVTSLVQQEDVQLSTENFAFIGEKVTYPLPIYQLVCHLILPHMHATS